jgi:hypothetical protein
MELSGAQCSGIALAGLPPLKPSNDLGLFISIDQPQSLRGCLL